MLSRSLKFKFLIIWLLILSLNTKGQKSNLFALGIDPFSPLVGLWNTQIEKGLDSTNSILLGYGFAANVSPLLQELKDFKATQFQISYRHYFSPNFGFNKATKITDNLFVNIGFKYLNQSYNQTYTDRIFIAELNQYKVQEFILSKDNRGIFLMAGVGKKMSIKRVYLELSGGFGIGKKVFQTNYTGVYKPHIYPENPMEFSGFLAFKPNKISLGSYLNINLGYRIFN
ncbi:MAG: hypothetical protein FGM41_10170 [Bacteroidetes bacterium]|nr:hypothetical protein [Bacteroidota bacterium]